MMTEKAIFLRRFGYIALGSAILAEFVYLYKDIFLWMQKAWFGYPPDRFGIFVPFIFLCMLLFKIKKSPGMKIETDFRGLLIFLLGVMAFLMGFVADINIIQAGSMVFMGFGILFFILGKEWGRSTFFPFVFLFFMFPTCSFLLESAFGVYFRNMISNVSGLALDILGGQWGIGNGILYLKDIDLPIQYFRESISSPMALLIITFMAAEAFFIKNRNKFIFVVLYWAPLFVTAHCVFTTAMGNTFEHNHFELSEAIWESRRWLPAVVFIFFLIPVGVLVKIIGSRKLSTG
jgi:hypothetical protein